MVKLLLERGADPNIPEEGIAPQGHALHSAVCNGDIEIVKGVVVACTIVDCLKVVFPRLSCVVFGILMVVVEDLVQLIADVASIAYARLACLVKA